jgi:cysteine desulfurase
LGRAAELAASTAESGTARTRDLRDYLERQIVARCEGITVNGDVKQRVPNISNMSFQGVDGESLLIALDLRGIAVSTGSACASGSLEPSHVLTALGLNRQQVRGSLRFSLSAYTTRDEIDYAVSALEETLERLRSMLPSNGAETGEILISDQ